MIIFLLELLLGQSRAHVYFLMQVGVFWKKITIYN